MSLEALAQGVAALITDATSTDVCFVHVVDTDTHELRLSGGTPPFDQLVGTISLPIGTGVTGWVAANAEPVVLVDRKRADSRYHYIPEFHGEDYTSMASVPMISRPGTLVGVLNVHTVNRRDFQAPDIELLTSIGALVAGAVENARLHRRLSEREQAREQFAEQMVALQESERRRLAAEIHDGISQRIVGLSFFLSAAADAIGSDPAFAAEQIDAARELAVAALDETRFAIAGLRPSVLDDLGLEAGLESLARSMAEVDIDVIVALERRTLPEHLETALYRITQESLQNVAKHAGAAHAVVNLGISGGQVVLQVTDDGSGFVTTTASPLAMDQVGVTTYGLAGMRERADLVGGTLEIISQPGRGTSITVKVPLKA
ncbi:MAG: GAF domain-containing sensor histidine kinase [Euzebya sp.]